MKQGSIKDYEIIKQLGSGAQGTVYKAIKNGKTIALKVIHLPNDSQKFQQTMNEIKVLEQVTSKGCHPNIVCYYDHYYDPDKDKLLIEMEYIEGDTLTEYLVKIRSNPARSPFLIRYLSLILKDLAKGLEYIHSKGLLHNDIKPANIMIDKSLTPKIIDFGIGCVSNNTCRLGKENHICCSGGIIGTPLYSPPEAFSDEGLRYPQSDVWSLGVSMYEGATGRFPFSYTNKSSLRDIIQGIMEEPIRPLYPNAPELSDESLLNSFITNFMLIRDPTKRVSSTDLTDLTQQMIK